MTKKNPHSYFTLDEYRLFNQLYITVQSQVQYTNQGVSVISRYAVQQELELGLLREVAIQDGCTLARKIYYIHRKDTPLALSFRLFLDFLHGNEGD